MHMSFSDMENFKINIEHVDKDLASAINQDTDAGEIRYWWLGQAGFAIKYVNQMLLIDPYLSDSLAEKYKDSEFKHQRMIPVPIEPDAITECTWYLCTHGHTDHMDPLTIQGVIKHSSPNFLIPKADISQGIKRGIPEDRLIAINAGETIMLSEKISVHAIPAAHEQLEVDENGDYKHLGYILSLGDRTLYHSGDCTPYPGLSDTLVSHHVSIALLPINGRDEYRRSRGVLGNFTVEEAIELCLSAKITCLIGHHFGMFCFNTIERRIAEATLKENENSLAWLLPEIGKTYSIKLDNASLN